MIHNEHGLAMASLFCGIGSLLTSCCCLGVILGIIGLICGYVAKSRGNDEAICLVGMVLSGVGIALYGVLTVIGMGMMKSPEYQNMLNSLTNTSNYN